MTVLVPANDGKFVFVLVGSDRLDGLHDATRGDRVHSQHDLIFDRA